MGLVPCFAFHITSPDLSCQCISFSAPPPLSPGLSLLLVNPVESLSLSLWSVRKLLKWEMSLQKLVVLIKLWHKEWQEALKGKQWQTVYEWKSGASKQLCPQEQRHVFACVQLHSTSPGPGAKNNFARNITTHNTFARSMNSLQSVRIGRREQIKAAVLRCKYCAAEWIQYFPCLDSKTQPKNSVVKFYSWFSLCYLKRWVQWIHYSH